MRSQCIDAASIGRSLNVWSNGTLWADAIEPGFAYWEKETGDICTIADKFGLRYAGCARVGCWLWEDWYIRSCSCQCMVWSCWHSSRHLPVVAIHRSAQSRKTGLTCTRSKTCKGCIFYGASALMGHQTAEPRCYWPVEVWDCMAIRHSAPLPI